MQTKKSEVIDDLKSRFLDGEKMTIKEIIGDYYTPKSPYNYLLTQNKVRGQLGHIKRWFRTQTLWFGNLDESGYYGLITTKEEAMYSMIRYYKFIKGTMAGATLLANDAQKKGLLPEGLVSERFLLAKIVEKEKK